MWITTNWKILKQMQRPYHFTCLLRNLIQVKKQDLEPDMVPQIGSKFGKEYVKAVYGHLGYFNYVQNTSCEMLGWMKHMLESRLLGQISITLGYADDTTLMTESEEDFTKEPLDESENRE